MKEMRGIHKFTWRMPSVPRLAALALGILATTGVWATDYYKWKDSAASGNWNDYANWQYSSDGETYADATSGQYPSSKDAVVSIPASVTAETLTITGDNSYLGTLTIARAVTLTGTYRPMGKSIAGEGQTLTLSSFTFGWKDKNNYGGCTIAPNAVIVGTVKNSSGNVIAFNGTTSGDSSAILTTNGSNTYEGWKLTDMTQFYGTVVGSPSNGGDRDSTTLMSTKAASENVVWTLGFGKKDKTDGVSALAEGKNTAISDATYKFGALNSYSAGFSLRNCSNVTLEIGARDDQESTLAINSSYLGTGNSIKKVGSNVLNFNGSISSMDIEKGMVHFTGDALPQRIVVEEQGGICLNDYMTSDYFGNLVVFNGESRNIGVYKGETASTEYAFSGVTDFTKKNGGTLEITATPGWTGTTTIESGALIIPTAALSSLSLAAGTVSVDMGGGRTMLYNSSEAYVWTGGGTLENGGLDANGFYIWNNANNWSLDGYPDSDTALVVIPASASVETLIITNANTSAYCYTGFLSIMRDVTMGGYYYVSTISGDGKLSLASAQVAKHEGAFTINCDLEVAGNVTNPSSDTDGSGLMLNGALTGTGSISCGKGRAWVQFNGDTTLFEGSYSCGGNGNSAQRDHTLLTAAGCGSASAKWTFCYYNATGYTYPFTESGTYYFGKLTSNTLYLGQAKSVVAEIGALAGQASVLTSCTLYDDSNILRKVGETSTLELSLNDNKGTIECKEGKTYLKGSNLPAALKLTGKDAELYVISTLDASSLVESGLSAYTVEKSTETETVSSVEYYKYTLTADTSSAVAYVGATEEERTYYNTIAEAIADAEDGATIVVTGDGGDIVIPAGRALSFTTAGGGTITSVTGADGSIVEVSDSVYTYSCPELFTATNSITGAYTLDGSYYAATDIFVPKETVGAVGTLNIGSGASLRAKHNVRIASKSNTTGVINVTTGGTLVHDTNGKFMLGGTAGSVANLNIAGGAVTNLTGNIECGYNASGATGTVNLSSGKLAMLAGTLVLGNKSGTEGVFNMSGGTFECPATTLDPIKIGTASGGTGTVNLSGNASLTLGKLPVGNGSGATGYVNVTDSASLTITNDFCIGASNGAKGNLTVNGGTVTVESTGKLIPGYNGTGVVEVVSGTLTAKADAYIGYGGNGNGYLKINGGTFSMPTKDLTVGNNNVVATGCVEVVSGSLCLAKELKLGAINGSESAGSKTSAIISGGKVLALRSF